MRNVNECLFALRGEAEQMSALASSSRRRLRGRADSSSEHAGCATLYQRTLRAAGGRGARHNRLLHAARSEARAPAVA